MNKRFVQAEVKSAKDAGEFEVILSTSALDRDGEIIAPYALNPLPDHINFDVDHSMTVEKVVGSGEPRYEDDGNKLVVRGTWASTPLAQMVRTLVQEGHVRTTSVALLPKTFVKKDGVPTVDAGELLNGAFVAIPANPTAVVLAAKSLAVAEAEEAEASVADDSDGEATHTEDADESAVESATTDEVVADETAEESAADAGMPDHAEVQARADAYRALAENSE